MKKYKKQISNFLIIFILFAMFVAFLAWVYIIALEVATACLPA